MRILLAEALALMVGTTASAEVFLVGTITGANPVALVRNGDRVLSLRRGEAVDGWTIKRIDAKLVVIASPRGEKILRTGEYVGSDELVERGISVADGEVVVSKAVHHYITGEGITKVVMDATADAVFENGRQVGYDVWNFDPGSVYDLIGLQQHDVITSIDGAPLDSPRKAIELLQAARSKEIFSFTRIRGGVTSDVKVRIK